MARQDDAEWPLYQLSAKDKNPTDHTYYYIDNAGKGVDIYILDSGIQHPLDEFKDGDTDRVVDDINCSDESDNNDNSGQTGHGTKAASAAAGSTYGIAKSANLINVKFHKGGYPDAAFLAKALDQVLQRHSTAREGSDFKGAVINMSFNVPRTNAVEKRLAQAWNAGISLVAAAGNDGYKPNYFPMSHDKVISVGATRQDYTPMEDEPSYHSNYGENVIDLWAPGRKVPLITSKGNRGTPSGTSFAAPYVAGILATFYCVEGPPTTWTPRELGTCSRNKQMSGVDLPGDGTDWHYSSIAFANNGNRKGDAEDPQVVYRDGPTTNSGNDADTGECSVEVGVAINRPENEKPLVTTILYNENHENENSWSAEMDVDESQSIGGLGPDVAWTLKSNTASDFPFDLDFTYDIESWNWLGCELMSDSDLGQGVTLESRKCLFPCHGRGILLVINAFDL